MPGSSRALLRSGERVLRGCGRQVFHRYFCLTAGDLPEFGLPLSHPLNLRLDNIRKSPRLEASLPDCPATALGSYIAARLKSFQSTILSRCAKKQKVLAMKTGPECKNLYH